MPIYAIVLIVVFSALVFLLSVCFLIGHFGFKSVFGRDDKPKDPNKKMVSPDGKYTLDYDEEWLKVMPIKEETIVAKDGIKLFGRLVMTPSYSHKYLISCHGYRGSWKEMSLPEHQLYNQGYSILMIDERAMGKSGGKAITFGYNERDDIKLWADYIVSLDKEAKIVLYGLSMGAGSIMMALNNSLPKAVKCVVCDCGYSSIKDELIYMLKQMKAPSKLIYRILAITAYFHHGFSFTKYSPVKSLKEDDIPILFIHGEVDTFVPFYMCNINFQAVKKGTYKQKETFPDAWHALSYQTDKERYNQIFLTFVNKFIV